MGGPIRDTDWPVIFDLIASEYGYTWEQFAGMTYRMLEACLEAIARRTHNNLAVRASMHGIQIDLYKRAAPVTTADAKAVDAAIDEMFREKNGER